MRIQKYYSTLIKIHTVTRFTFNLIFFLYEKKPLHFLKWHKQNEYFGTQDHLSGSLHSFAFFPGSAPMRLTPPSSTGW